MRLDFKVLLVDDDYADPIKARGIVKISEAISGRITNKGFTPHVVIKSDISHIEPEHKTRRTDLFISDNNLGGQDESGLSNGIDFYFSLKRDFICDFILYTSSDKSEIVNKLITKLHDTQDPNIFSRFNFVSRRNGDEWYESIYSVIDHILSKREEINNLRGLYAELMSKIYLKLAAATNFHGNFDELIDLAYEKKKISLQLKRFLHHHRAIRNGLSHNDEELCTTRNEYKVKYHALGKDKYIYEAEFQDTRLRLREVYNQVKELP